MDIRDIYLATWNEGDPEARGSMLATHWEASATYVDPLAAVAGVEAISALVDTVHAQYPGFVFTPVGEVDTHHDVARFQWGLGLPGAEPAAVGFDVVSTSPDGHIRAVTGFIDAMPG